MQRKPEVGEKVCYCPTHARPENGIVKEARDGDADGVFVVYNCGGDWANYRNYTAAKTNLRDLQTGWRKDARNV